MTISDDAVHVLLGITNGHPDDTPKLGYLAWAAAEVDDSPADRDTVELALATAIATDTARYTELWDGLTTNQRRLLRGSRSRCAPSVRVVRGFPQAPQARSVRNRRTCPRLTGGTRARRA